MFCNRKLILISYLPHHKILCMVRSGHQCGQQLQWCNGNSYRIQHVMRLCYRISYLALRCSASFITKGVHNAKKSHVHMVGLPSSNVTIHGKTNHIAHIWVKVTITKYDLWTVTGKNFEVSSPCRYGDMSKHVPKSPILKLSMKHCCVHCTQTVHVLTVYAKCVALSTVNKLYGH